MPRLFTSILLLLIATKSLGQDREKFINYHAGINVNYAGEKSPAFTLPFGFGLSVAATLNTFQIFKPVIELNATGYPEFNIPLTNNGSHDNPKYSYGVYNILIGTKYKLNKCLKVSLTAGPTLNSRENILRTGLKPALEFNTKNNKFIAQLFYFNIFHSEIIKGYAGAAFLFKIR